MACAIYVVSLFLPFVIISYSSYGQIHCEFIKGTDFLEFFSFFIMILLLCTIVKHYTVLKWVAMIFSGIFLVLCVGFAYSVVVITLYGVNGHEESLGFGFFLCLISSVLFLAVSIIKFRIPVLNEPVHHNGLIDNFR